MTLRGSVKRTRSDQRSAAALIIACVALFSSLVGGAAAVTLITGQSVKDGSLTGRDVRNESLTGRDLRNHSIDADKLAHGAIRRAEPGAVGPPGERGPVGPRGEQGLPGPIAGVPAGGDLTGVYPEPSLRPGSVTPTAMGPVPAVVVQLGESIIAPDDTRGFAVPFPFEQFDTADMHDNTVHPEQLTMPRAGIYDLRAALCWSQDEGPAVGVREIAIETQRVDSAGTLVPATTTAAATDAYDDCQEITALANLAAGDHVRLLAYENSGGTVFIDLRYFAAPRTWLSAVWIGPAS